MTRRRDRHLQRDGDRPERRRTQSYSWNFDGAAPGSAAPSPQLTFANAGQYNVTVQVTDAAGGGGVASVPITVGTRPAPATGGHSQTGAGTNRNSHSPTGPKKSGGHHAGGPRASRNRVSRRRPARATARTRDRQGIAGDVEHPRLDDPELDHLELDAGGASSHSATTSASPHRATTSTERAKRAPVPPAQPTTPLPLAGPRVSGLLVSDVTPVAADASPLVAYAGRAPRHRPSGAPGDPASPLPALGAGLALVLLLGLGAGRELPYAPRLAGAALRQLRSCPSLPCPYFALSTNSIDQAIFHVASALEVPVLILALLALALVIYELGSYVIELRSRSGRRFDALRAGADGARKALLDNDRPAAEAAVSGLARSAAMASTLAFIVEQAGTDGGEHQLNKALADFDFDAQRRLARTRMLVRAGPALGLMGTLIPLSPALTGLAAGNTGAAQPRPAGRVQRHGRRPADRRGSVRAVALARPHVQPGPVRPPVPRGGHQRSTTRRRRNMISVTPHARKPRRPRRRPARRPSQPVRPRDRAVGRVPARGAVVAPPRRGDHQPGAAGERHQEHLHPARTDGRAAAQAGRAHDRPRRRRPESFTGSANGQLVYVQKAPSATEPLNGYIWDQLRGAIPLIAHGNPYIVGLLWVTIRVAVVSTAAALVIGLPIGAGARTRALPGRRTLQILANASLALPPVVVGDRASCCSCSRRARSARCGSSSRSAPCTSRRRCSPSPTSSRSRRRRSRACRPGCSSRPGRSAPAACSSAVFALQEAKIGVIAAVIAALGATISEVGAVIIVGGNIQGRDETLASALLEQFNYTAHEPVRDRDRARAAGADPRADRDADRDPAAHGRRSSCASGRRDVQLIWDEIRKAVPMIFHGNPTLFSIIWFTLQVALVATAAATRDRPADRARDRPRAVPGQAGGCGCSRTSSLAIPPVLVGSFLFVLFMPQAPLGSLHLI